MRLASFVRADGGKWSSRASSVPRYGRTRGKRATLDDQARHQWVATQILPHEGEVRAWLRRHVHSLAPSDIDDLIQDAYARLWSVEFTRITNARSYLFAVVRNLLLEYA